MVAETTVTCLKSAASIARLYTYTYLPDYLLGTKQTKIA